MSTADNCDAPCLRSLWELEGIPGVHCFRAVRLAQSYCRHSHEGYALGVIENGVGASTYRGRTFLFPADHVIAMNPDEPHTGYPATPAGLTYRMFYVAPRALERLLDIKHRVAFPAVCIADAQLARQLLRAHDVIQRDSTLAGQVAFVEFLQALVATYAGTLQLRVGEEPQAVRSAKEYLRAHCSRNVTIRELAELTDLSEAHLIRVFRNTVGVPPHAWSLQARLEFSKSLISAGRSLADAALEAGFADQSHFTRRFRRMFGVTPHVYARTNGCAHRRRTEPGAWQ